MTQPLAVRFLGTGAYVPEKVITNEHFASYLATSDEWIVTRTGIRERRWASKDECTSTLAVRAARLAIEDAGLAAEDIDVIICATATGDVPLPPTAAIIQSSLGIRNIPAFDISAACAGFVYAVKTAAGLLACGLYRHALVIGAETLSRIADPEDRASVILFGDAAGAVVLSAGAEPDQGILYTHCGCNGRLSELIWIPAGGSRRPTSSATVAERLHYMRMRGREVYKFAVTKMQDLIEGALRATDLTPDDLKLVIPHQSNLRILESARSRLGLPKEKVAVNIDRFGNTSSASLPMLLDEARRNGTVGSGDVVLLVAIGAGITWGTMVVRL